MKEDACESTDEVVINGVSQEGNAPSITRRIPPQCTASQTLRRRQEEGISSNHS